MALGSTKPLTEMSTGSISWGYRRPVRKADNLLPSWAVVTKSGNLNFLENSGPLRACNGTDLPFTTEELECLSTSVIARRDNVNVLKNGDNIRILLPNV